MARRVRRGDDTTLSAEARQRLQALGYVAASAGAGKRTFTDADDPKVLIGPANRAETRPWPCFRKAIVSRVSSAPGRSSIAYPSFSTAYGVLASMRHDSGDLASAIATLETVASSGIADQSVLVVLAGYLMEARPSRPRLQTCSKPVCADHPDYAEAFNVLGVVSSRMGRHERAQAAWRRVLELDPTSATAYENLGVDALGRGDLSGALTNLQRALEVDPGLARARTTPSPRPTSGCARLPTRSPTGRWRSRSTRGSSKRSANRRHRFMGQRPQGRSAALPNGIHPDAPPARST